MQQQSNSLEKLAIFAAVADEKSFSAAATKLALPRSSVSRAVAALEEELGAVLLHRTTRKVSLSPAGEVLLARVAPGLSSLKSALETPLSDDAEDRGAVRVTAVEDFAAAVLAEVVAAFVLRWPQIRVELVLTDRVVDLKGEGVDVAFRFSFGRLKGDGLVAQKLGAVSLGLYASPTFLARAGGAPKNLDELKQHPSVGTSMVSRIRLKSTDGRRMVESQPVVVCNSMATCRALVVASAGIAILPHHFVKGDVQHGALVAVLPQWTAWNGSLWLVLAQKKVPGPVRKFCDFVVANAGDWF